MWFLSLPRPGIERTGDLQIFGLTLSQLSYRGMRVWSKVNSTTLCTCASPFIPSFVELYTLPPTHTYPLTHLHIHILTHTGTDSHIPTQSHTCISAFLNTFIPTQPRCLHACIHIYLQIYSSTSLHLYIPAYVHTLHTWHTLHEHSHV